MINTYRNSNTEFDTAVKGLLQNYEGTEISEEALSDISAQLFGNQEFINNIAQNNPNIFQKLYSEIKYLWHQFRGYKNQNQFVEDLYYKWTQAYNSNKGLNGTRNYSIAGINAVNNIQNNSDLYNQAINKYNQANTMANQGIDNEIIRQNTGWFQDKNGHWKFEFSDKHMSLKNMKYEVGKKYELGNILNHNELFMFYPELAKYNVEFVEEKNSKKKAKYDDETKTISINSQLLNKKNAQELIKCTLCQGHL